jgi:hypothetical protein
MFMLEDLAPNVQVYPCRVRTVGETLDSKDRNIFVDALGNNLAWSNNGLSEALAKLGVKISEKSIRKHRRGECSCA